MNDFEIYLCLSVEWPLGTYTLVKPRSGCPLKWWEGWAKQDSEDSNNQNSMSYGHHFDGMLTRMDIILTVC